MKTILLLFTALLLSACGSQTPAPESGTEPVDPAIQSVFTPVSSDTEPLPIPQARAEKAPGDSVVLEGRIMGVMEPFVEGRSAFVLGDNSVITPCSDMEMSCDTPWDACCDPNDVRVDGTATIQIVDADGRVLRQGLEGVNGLTKLASVRVGGTLNPASSPQSLIVNATSIELLNQP
jgi:hypothetical protein